MSEHADTIREWVKEQIVLDGASGGGHVLECLDALLAEIKRLEHERNFLQRELGFKNTQRQEIQRLRDALERIANLTGAPEYHVHMLRIAREALAGDGE